MVDIKSLPKMGWGYLKGVSDKGLFHLISANFFVQFLGFGTSLLVIKFLSPEEFGRIKIIQSYIAIFGIIAAFGFNSAVLKYCSENRSEADREGILRKAFLLSISTTGLSVLLLLIFSITGVLTSSPEISKWLIVYSLIIPFSVITDLLMIYLQSQKKIKRMARTQTFIKGQSFIIIIFSTWYFGFQGFMFATIGAYILGLLPLFYQIGFGFLRTKSRAIPIGFFSVAIYSVLANGVSTIRLYADIYILDHFYQNRTEIGYYSLATIFILAATQIIASIQAISTPYFSEHASDTVWFRRKLWITQLQTIGVSILIAILIYILALVLIELFFGTSYSSTLSYLSILLIKFIITSSFAIIGVALFALGLVKYNFIAALITMIIGLGLTYIFLIRVGINGVAWAQVIAAIINLVILMIFMASTFRNKNIG